MLPPMEAPQQRPGVEAWLLSRMLEGDTLIEAAQCAQAEGYARNDIYRARLRIAGMFEEES